jgi:hypothetical protein
MRSRSVVAPVLAGLLHLRRFIMLWTLPTPRNSIMSHGIHKHAMLLQAAVCSLSTAAAQMVC